MQNVEFLKRQRLLNVYLLKSEETKFLVEQIFPVLLWVSLTNPLSVMITRVISVSNTPEIFNLTSVQFFKPKTG